MAVMLPNINPTTRDLDGPEWATTSSTSQSGVQSLRLWADQPVTASLAASYTNIWDHEAAQFRRVQREAKGPTFEILLPAEFYRGMEPELEEEMRILKTVYGLKWYFPERGGLRIRSVKAGVSSVQLSLVAQLRL